MTWKRNIIILCLIWRIKYIFKPYVLFGARRMLHLRHTFYGCHNITYFRYGRTYHIFVTDGQIIIFVDVVRITYYCWQNHKWMLTESHFNVDKITNDCWQNHISMLTESQMNVDRITYQCWQNHILFLNKYFLILIPWVFW